jgi:hypothetical protein
LTTDYSSKPKVIRQTIGRALFVTSQGRCYISRKYDIYRSDDWGAAWQLDCRAPAAGWKSFAARSSLVARLLRHYIAAFQVLDDGSRVAVASDGLYRAENGEIEMKRVFTITRGSRPLNLAADGSRLIFGEYGSGLESSEVFIYVSEDRGNTWHVGYRFPAGDIRHVHNILIDPWANHYWVLVGDFDHQPGIGAMSKDLRTIDWIARGNQLSRAVEAIIKPDCLLYGTDSDRSRNYIARLDKQTGQIAKLLEVEGSSHFSASFGPVHAISTCVEPNPVCPSRECSLYVSRDGDSWNRTVTYKKDLYNFTLFQFGNIVLPFSRYEQPMGIYSAQAVVGAHDLVTVLNFDSKE